MRAAYGHTALAWIYARAASILCAGCATAHDPRDPLEPINREVFKFNDAVDKVVTKPVAQGLPRGGPAPGARRRHQLLRQLPRRHHGDQQPAAAQGAARSLRRRPRSSSTAPWASSASSTSPAGSAWRSTTRTSVRRWATGACGTGAYLVLPLLGPSTARDTVGLVGDYFTDPEFYIFTHTPENYIVFGTRIINLRANLLAVEGLFDQAADSTTTPSCAMPICSAGATRSTTATRRACRTSRAHRGARPSRRWRRNSTWTSPTRQPAPSRACGRHAPRKPNSRLQRQQRLPCTPRGELYSRVPARAHCCRCAPSNSSPFGFLMTRLLAAFILGAVLLPSAQAGEPQGVLANIKKTGVIRLGYLASSPPFSFDSGGNSPAGFSVDLCQHAAEGIRKQLGLASLRIEWVKLDLATGWPPCATARSTSSAAPRPGPCRARSRWTSA